MTAREDLAAYAITTRTVTADGLAPYIEALVAEVRDQAATDVHRARLPEFPAGEAPDLAARTVRAVDVRIAVQGANAPYAVVWDEPLVVSRFDVAMEPAPEEEQVLTIGCIAEDGRPVALLLDVDDRRKVAAWLAPDAAITDLAAAVADQGALPVPMGEAGS